MNNKVIILEPEFCGPSSGFFFFISLKGTIVANSLHIERWRKNRSLREKSKDRSIALLTLETAAGVVKCYIIYSLNVTLVAGDAETPIIHLMISSPPPG